MKNKFLAHLDEYAELGLAPGSDLPKPQCALLSLCAEIKVPALRVYYDEDHDRIVDVRWGLKVLTSEAEVTFGGIKEHDVVKAKYHTTILIETTSSLLGLWGLPRPHYSSPLTSPSVHQPASRKTSTVVLLANVDEETS